MKFKEKFEVWIVKMWMSCIWYDCSLKITSTIVWVCHTHVFPCFAEFQENQLKLICLVLGGLGEKGEFSHCMSASETCIKNTGSSRNIMKGIITFQASCSVSETDKFPTHRIPMHYLSRAKKESHIQLSSLTSSATFNTFETKRSSATGAS